MSSRTTGQISRLAAVSHVLYEREVLELRGENARLLRENEAIVEALKLKLFWREHSVFMLAAAIVRADRHFAPENSGIWYEWIGPMLQTHGLTLEIVQPFPAQICVSMPRGAPRHIELDTHLVCASRYTVRAYGAKLWKAKSVDDPELQKLKALFDALNDVCDTPVHRHSVPTNTVFVPMYI
jgi:hypothetical protein